MPRTRAASVVSDRVTKSLPMSPMSSDVTGHHLRSRKNINYMTPPLDDDSLQEKLELNLEKPVNREYKEYRELRSSTRALAKLTRQISDHHEEVWNSGRPKRACITRQKRVSADERLVADNKTYYKVEVLSSKLRSSTHHLREQDVIKTCRSQSSRQDEDDKGLIVKFKKLRNSELVQLNNEATNFLFPKKDDDESSEEEDSDQEGANTRDSLLSKNDSSDTEDSTKISQNFKVEDDISMDSTCSDSKRKRKRRTHAEAFIMDNQKYYKFETPGSRLRYQGSYLPIMKSPKHGVECSVKVEKGDAPEQLEQTVEVDKNAKVSLGNYKFSFEKVPENASWYNTFQRIDKGEQRYNFVSDYFYWDPFVLPYQMPSIAPLDPKSCISHYKQLLRYIREPASESESVGSSSTPDPSVTSTPTAYVPDLDEDSKLSVATVSSSTCSMEEPPVKKKRGRRPRALVQQVATSGKNPRKSPRQHASTLAILSSLIHQRKRRSRNKDLGESNNCLPAIPEETDAQESLEVQQQSPQAVLQTKPKTPLKRLKSKIDYVAMVKKIDEEFDKAWEQDSNLEELDVEKEEDIDFRKGRTNIKDIMRKKSKGHERSCKRLFNSTPGRKPGRRKKKNKTGWPNKNKRLSKKGQDKEKEEDNDDSTIDSVSVNMDSDEEDVNSTDSVKKMALGGDKSKSDQNDVNNDQNSDVDRVEEVNISDKVLTNRVTNRTDFQPYVCVQKLDSDKLLGKQIGGPKRTSRRQRRMPGSPKSPRMLRRPRGRWYRER
ncbi:hypothetical protein NQ315_011109 [Exocentrus adspersus]|uniref:Uncharacterized protein n=1 Tax=Exocentrus adspersus TaxID=1586481 RepID=A0AAV8VWU5_9CUCU|nr:hypothetical protein NQ315_011109 [Exocentrus adspersus]